MVRKAVPIFLGFAGAAVLALMLLAPEFFKENAYNLSSSLSSSFVVNGGPGSGGGTRQQSRRVAQLEKEVERLKEVLAQEQAAAANPEEAAGLPAVIPPAVEDRSNFSVTIDLLQLLGNQQFFAGISWDPMACYPGWKAMWPKMPEEKIAAAKVTLMGQLQAALAEVKGVNPQEIATDKAYFSQPIFGDSAGDESLLATDPDLPRWHAKIMPVISKWLVRGDPAQGKDAVSSFMDGENTCTKVKGKTFTADQFGTDATDCTSAMSEKEILEYLGYFPTPNTELKEIAHVYIEYGTCGLQVKNHKNFATWLRTERIFNPEWMTFPVATPEQDAVVLLLDVLYEKMTVFRRQYWQGVITMQNPFDMYAIQASPLAPIPQDIIFTVRPTLIIETGTANGGSALLWASILHLSDLDESQIITIDVYKPSWKEGEATWGGVVRKDPTKHKLWQKHVQFLEGSTVNKDIISKVKSKVAGQTVMVVLDSHHAESHVTDEMEVYCPLVSVGSYCIVEDTKMSRWSSTGPLESIKIFLQKHKNFEMDRSRELMYSHHAMGYLKRIS